MSIFLNTPSRNIPSKNYSWDSVVYQTGRPLLDADINLQQEIFSTKSPALPLPSGVLAYSPIRGDSPYSFDNTANQLKINPFMASVAGLKVHVAGTANADDGVNLIALPEPSDLPIDPATYNKVHFVFLECWKAEVAPSSSARVALRLVNSLVTNDVIRFINPDGPSQVEVQVGDEFELGANAYETASNLANAINSLDPANFSGLTIQAETKGSEIVVITFGAGSAGNNVIVQLLTNMGNEISTFTPSGGTDGLNKPEALKVYKYGNVLCDSSLYLDDNIIDPLLQRESARRIQIQYRIRVLDVDFDSNLHPEGFSHPNCFAQGAGIGSTYHFLRVTGSENDPGLWRAGAGDSDSYFHLGSVDGYVYAIPLCMVSRRNSAGFDAVLNANGGILSTLDEASDRPDGKFADLVYEDDVLDMMRHVYPFGLDYASETTFQFQSLLDQNYHTMFTFEDPAGSQTGTRSITPMVCDEIGQFEENGGLGDGSNRGNFIRSFDHIARRFGSQPVIEFVTFKLFPTTNTGWLSVTKASGVNWFDGDQIDLNLLFLDPFTLSNWADSEGGMNVVGVFPAGTYFIDLVDAWHNDGNTTTPISKKVEFASITGLGSNFITLVLDRNRRATNTGVLVGDAGLGGDQGSDNAIYLRFAVSYPANQGLTQTPIHDGYGATANFPNGAYVEVDPANRPLDIAEGSAPYIHIRQGYRDVCAYYLVSMLEAVTPETDLVSLKLQHPIHYAVGYHPEVVDGSDNSLGYQTTLSKLGSTESILTLTDPRPNQAEVYVSYYARMPLSLHPNGYQMAIYYKACAKQSMYSLRFLNQNIGTLVKVKPLYVPPNLWVIQGGKGSVDLGYPYYAPSEQLAVRQTQESEGLLSATPRICLSDFNIDTGVVSLSCLLPIDISGNLTFSINDLGEDEEGRSFFFSTLDSAYRPMTIAMGLKNHSTHKTAIPFLARVVEDTPLLRRGEVVLVVFSRLSELSKENKVVLSDGDNKTVASIYRTKNLMVVGD